MPKVFDFFQDAIKSCNVFTSPVNLRYKLDPDYNTFAGGIVSIILVILLISVFFNAWMDLLSKSDIASNTQIIREFDPSYLKFNSTDFMFAIGVNGINLSDFSMKKYFDLKVRKFEMIKGQKIQINSTPLDLQPCTVEHWESFGKDFVQTFYRQKLNDFLCFPKNTQVEIVGKWTSQKFAYVEISFEKCKNRPDCRDQSEIDEWVAANTAFFFNFFYTNELLNPEQKQPISKIIEDKDYTMFSPKLGSVTNLYFGEYTMQTDQSIFPWIDKKVDQGFIVNRAQKQTLNFVPDYNNYYCQLVLRKSNARLQIQRKFRKLDDMLSYIGGLFGIIAVAIGVVMKYYGQCSFQLEMCQKIFDYQSKKQVKHKINIQVEPSPLQNNFGNGWSTKGIEDGNQETIEPKKFGFLDFSIHVLIYTPLKKIFNMKWQRMQIYQESLEEIRHKLDIGQMLEKLTFYDRSINALFDENQLKLLYLQQKINFKQVRDQRNMLGLREGIVANLFGLGQKLQNETEEPTGVQCKKPLTEIAQRNSKRLQSWIGNRPDLQFFQLLTKPHPSQNNQQKQDFGLPPDIKNALKKLDSKIENGDIISTRIYNGLQYELLEAFEKSKLNKNNHRVTMKKSRNCQMGRAYQNSRLRKDKVERLNYAQYVNSPSLSSIDPIKTTF